MDKRLQELREMPQFDVLAQSFIKSYEKNRFVGIIHERTQVENGIKRFGIFYLTGGIDPGIHCTTYFIGMLAGMRVFRDGGRNFVERKGYGHDVISETVEDAAHALRELGYTFRYKDDIKVRVI